MKYLNSINSCIIFIFSINNSFKQESVSRNDKSLVNSDAYMVNKKALSADIKLMHEFIEFKYFKKVMNQNNDIFNN